MTLVVGLHGKQGAGKSTIAHKAVELLIDDDIDAKVMSFAEPLYDMMSALLGQDARSLDKSAPMGSLRGRTLRHALQTLGTEWGRDCMGAGIWLRVIQDRIHAGEHQVVILDDVRFPNEAEFCRNRGLVCEVRGRGYKTQSDAHESEQHTSELDRYTNKYLVNSSDDGGDQSAKWLARQIYTESFYET